MKKIYLITFLAFLFLSQVSFGQRRGGDSKEWWDKVRTEKISFITENLDLTPDEAEKFWPVYNQLEKEKESAQKRRRELEKKVKDGGESLSESETIKLTSDFAGSLEKEGALMKKYNEEFLKILPPKKVLRLYQVENEFRMHMFRKYRDRNRKKENHP